MTYPVAEIEGIGEAIAAKLAGAGLKTTADLLEQCGSAAGRKAVAGTTGIDEKKLLAFVNMADLMRITGVAGEFSELLEAGGVDTVKELRHRNPENLAGTLAEVNEKKKLTRRTPSASEVARWIEQAKSLPPMVSH